MSNVVTAKAKCVYVGVKGHKRNPKGAGVKKVKKTAAQKAKKAKTAKKAKK
jgi:hypothetical protein